MPIWPQNTREWNRENDDWEKVTNVKNLGPGKFKIFQKYFVKNFKRKYPKIYKNRNFRGEGTNFV